MYNVNAAKKLGDLEIDLGLEGSRSWHHQYRNSAYIFVGGLHHGLSEGDVVIVFSQFGEIVDVNLVRDKNTGKSQGFAYICYEDQRSTVLAVDNMNGFQLVNKTLRVDHCEKYKAPKKFDEENLDADGDPTLLEYKATGAEGVGHGMYNALPSQQRATEAAREKEMRRKKLQAELGPEDEDEAWARQFEQTLKGTTAEDDKKLRKAKKKKKEKLKQELKVIKQLKMELKRVKGETKRWKKLRKQQMRSAKVKQDSSDASSSSVSRSEGDASGTADDRNGRAK